MAANKITKRNIVRHGAWLTLALASIYFSAGIAAAQGDPNPAPQVRQALRAGIELYKKQDYEEAAKFFAFAQSGLQGLMGPDLEDLAKFSAQNTIALKSRQDGGAQLRLADAALQENRVQDAGNHIKSLNSNQYLNAAERVQLGDLNRKYQTASNQAAQPLAGKADAKSLLASGRAALLANDLAKAELMAEQAEKASSLMPSWLQPWNDSPSKLRRDIQSAKAKQQTALPAKTEPEKDSSWMPGLGKIFSKSDKPAAKDASSSERRVDEAMSRQIVKDGFVFLEANDLEKAKFLAIKAKEMNSNWGPNEPTPDMLLHEIQRRTGGPALPTTPMAKAPTTKAPETPLSDDPRVLVKQGRALMAQKKYDEADKACTKAVSLNARWGLFEDTPDKLRRDLQRGRASHERDESVKLIADARKLFTSGNLDEAEKKAFKAKQLHGPYGVFDFGDRPDKLLEEIQRTRQAKGLPEPKDNKVLTKDNTPPLAIPAGVQNANRNRVIVMLREAGELERQGMLLEARQKALEARALKAPFTADEESPDSVLSRLYATCDRQIAAHLQHAAGIVTQTGDAQRFEKVQVQLLMARKLAQTFELDSGRIDQTTHYVQQVQTGARPLANAAANVPLGGNPLAVDLANLNVPTGDPRKDKARLQLHQAQLELEAGKTAQARKEAERLYAMEPSIQPKMLALIRSISAKEYNQQVVEAKRTFDAGLDAFLQKDYRKAMFVFRNVDTMMLPTEYQGRLRDIMVTREMQPQQIAQIGERQYLEGSKIEPKSIDPKAGPEPENLIEQQKAKDAIRYQALRQRGVEAMRSAHEMFKETKKERKDQAVASLRNYVEQVKTEQLDAQRTADLCRLPEARIQQYKTMLSDEIVKTLQDGGRFPMQHDETARNAKIRERQQEVADKMKVVTDLMKQNKLKEADVQVALVLEIDSENLAARAAKNIINVKRNQQDYDRQVHANEKIFLDSQSVGIGPVPTMDQPVTFGDRTKNRPKDSGSIMHELRDPKERQIEYRLRQPISLHFKDVPLRQAIEDLKVQSGIQVVADERALDTAKINLEAPLSISVDNIDMKSALKLMLNKLQLTYIIENQVLMITTEEKTKGRLVRITYPIADLIVVVPDHPLPDVLDIRKALERSMAPAGMFNNNYLTPPPYAFGAGVPVSSHTGGLGNTFGGQQMPHGQAGQMSPSPKGRTKEHMAEVLKDLISNTVSKNSWEAMGGTGNIQYFPMGMALVITQLQEVQEEIQLLLATLRRLQDLQVSIELRAVLVSESFFERIGVDFDMNIRTPTSRREPDLLNSAFVSAPFANRNLDKMSGLVSGITSAGTFTPDLNIPVRNSTFAFTAPQFGGYQPEAGLSLGLAFLSDIQVFMFLEAVQGDRRAHIMQAPKLTAFNGQQAFIQGSMVRPTLGSLQPLALANGNFIMVPQFNQMPFGLAMLVTPVVSPDRRFIRLNVTPIFSQGVQDPTAQTLTTIPLFQQAFFDGGVPQPPSPAQPLFANIQQQLQATNLFMLETTVNVPDGGTVLLGGFKFLAEERSEYGPPILSKIPYLSRLFRNVGWSRDSSTLIYLVTARVIMVEEEERIFMGDLQPIR